MWNLDDFADACCDARREKNRKVERKCDQGLPFITVYGSELLFMAYLKMEIEKNCEAVKLNLIRFPTKEVFPLCANFK